MQMNSRNYTFLFILCFILLFGKSILSVDNSDILIDRVFITAVKKSNYQKVEEMLNKDAAINYKDSKNLVALAYALENEDKRMFKLLVNNGADVKTKILKKSSLLIFYVSMNKHSLIEDILHTGVDVDFQDNLGMTALMHSIEKANVNAVNKLLRTDFDIELTDFSGKTVFEYSDLSRNILIKKLVNSFKVTN